MAGALLELAEGREMGEPVKELVRSRGALLPYFFRAYLNFTVITYLFILPF